MIKVPGKAASAGRKTSSLTDLVDLFPTLSALAGLPRPVGIDGDDVSALLDSPSAQLKAAAFHQYPACGMNASVAPSEQTRLQCNRVNATDFDYMAYSIRTAEWRYTPSPPSSSPSPPIHL